MPRHSLWQIFIVFLQARGLFIAVGRAGQYCSDDYQATLTAYNLTCSMSCKVNYWGNAVAENFFYTLRTEWIYQHKLENIAQAKSMILWYIEAYYNRVRKHSHLDYLLPVQFENKQAK
ncbi:integrase core domain-containing protein [Entomomonas moraniae]|nr:IS3 family transposase [Entomomonas moraniae]